MFINQLLLDSFSFLTEGKIPCLSPYIVVSWSASFKYHRVTEYSLLERTHKGPISRYLSHFNYMNHWKQPTSCTLPALKQGMLALLLVRTQTLCITFSKGSNSSPASIKSWFTAIKPSWLVRFLRLLARASSLPYTVLESMKDVAALSCSRRKVPRLQAEADCTNGMQVSELSIRGSSGGN